MNISYKLIDTKLLTNSRIDYFDTAVLGGFFTTQTVIS